MQDSDPAKQLAKPDSIWNKPLKADFKQLFGTLGRGLVHFTTANWSKLSADAVKALNAVGLEEDPAGLAWLLTRRAMTEAIFELVGEAANLFEEANVEPSALGDRIAAELSEQEVRLDRSLIEHPSQLPFVATMQVALSNWLVGRGLSDSDSKAIAARLPRYFAYCVRAEQCRLRSTYRPLFELFEAPAQGDVELADSWAAYGARLDKHLDLPMFDESFGLRAVYVPLNAYYETHTDAGDSLEEVDRPDNRTITRHVVELSEALGQWLEQSSSTDAVRVISGGPGSGKSSFARVFAAEVAQQGLRKAVFIPLHQFDLERDLQDSLDRFSADQPDLPSGLLGGKSGDSKLLLVFDGLDELSQQGKAAAETASNFVREVEKTLSRLNQPPDPARLMVVISGRPVAIDSQRHEFRKEGQLLHVLPYHGQENGGQVGLAGSVQVTDPLGLLKEDKRDDWWRRFGQLRDRSYEAMPDELRRKDLDEITTQPLLNYLVALTHGRGKVDFKSGDVNLNEIYADLLKAVYERGYEGRPISSIREMKPEQFARVLEEIGIASWHGDGRTTTVRAIREHCDQSGVTKLLKVFQEGAEAGVTRLLAAFYFRQHGTDKGGDKTFEFTHKSFGEYLTARRVVRELKRLNDELRRCDEDCDEGIDEREALERFGNVCGPTALTTDLVRFAQTEVSLQGNKVARRWQQTLVRLINHLLRHGMPAERFAGVANFFQMGRNARNAEESLLVLLQACSRVTEEVSEIDWPDELSASRWLSWLQPARKGSQNGLSLQSLSRVSLSQQVLHVKDLRLADLQGADLQGADLQRADLQEADLQGAKLQGADLRGANLQGADLRGADLQGADLQRAKLQRAKLQGAKLQGADLQGANLKHRLLVDRSTE